MFLQDHVQFAIRESGIWSQCHFSVDVFWQAQLWITRDDGSNLVGEVALSGTLARNGYPAPRDIRWTKGGQRFAGALQFRSRRSQKRLTSTPRRGGAGRHHARGPLGSGASRPHLRLLRLRGPSQVRLKREVCLVFSGACQLCAQTKEAK